MKSTGSIQQLWSAFFAFLAFSSRMRDGSKIHDLWTDEALQNHFNICSSIVSYQLLCRPLLLNECLLQVSRKMSKYQWNTRSSRVQWQVRWNVWMDPEKLSRKKSSDFFFPYRCFEDWLVAKVSVCNLSIRLCYIPFFLLISSPSLGCPIMSTKIDLFLDVAHLLRWDKSPKQIIKEKKLGTAV